MLLIFLYMRNCVSILYLTTLIIITIIIIEVLSNKNSFYLLNLFQVWNFVGREFPINQVFSFFHALLFKLPFQLLSLALVMYINRLRSWCPKRTKERECHAPQIITLCTALSISYEKIMSRVR